MDLTLRTETGVLNCRTAALIMKEGYILLHKNLKDDYWVLPGGRIKLHENSAAALEREIFEELHIQGKSEKLVLLSENFFEYDGQRFHEYGFYYEFQCDELIVCEEGFKGYEDEHLIYQWHKIECIGEVNLYPEALRGCLPLSNFKHEIT